MAIVIESMKDIPFERIISFLKENNVEYQLTEHEPVFTSQEAATVRGFSLHEGGKALLIKAKDQFMLIVIPGDFRLDSKKLKALLGIKKLRFATPEEVVDIAGCKIGAVYPFGNLMGIPMIVEKAFTENEYIAFNPGVHDKTIRMKWTEYLSVVNPRIEDVSA